MSNKEILVTKEKCLDCHNFVRPFLCRHFSCRFGLVPVVVEHEVVCLEYVDRPGEATASRVLNRLRSKAKSGDSDSK